MPKQTSIRLPALVAAKLNALSEMYPRVTKTELINDLIATALIDFQENLEWIPVGPVIHGDDQTGEVIHADYRGPGREFSDLLDKHIALLEKELGVQLVRKEVEGSRDE